MVIGGKHLWHQLQLINRAFVCILLLELSLFAVDRCHADDDSIHTGLDTDNASLKAIANGFDQRVRQAFEAESGKPLVRAKKQPPLEPGRGNFVRSYSWSIIDFAARCFILNEQITEANAALRENAQHYLDNPKDINDQDSFHWHAEMLCRLIESYGTKGSVSPGRLTPETEKMIMEPLWRYASEYVHPNETDVKLSQTWHIHGSDNHHAMDVTAKWHFAKLASKHSLFQARRYPDGSTSAMQYAAWNEYLRAYCAERAKKGLFVETASDNYNMVGIKGFYNLYDFADDPVLKRRAGYLLDLFWAIWAQEQIDGVRGGGKARIYQTGADRQGHSNMRDLAWFYFAIGEPSRPVNPLLPALLSDWRPPLVVVDLASNTEGRRCYEIKQRLMGLAEKGYDDAPDYRLKLNGGGILRYSWCTPEFILGTSMVEPRPVADWARISSQNRWHGVIFQGDKDARIVPQVRANDGRAAVNAQWSVQRKGTLICQKLKTSKASNEMRVWFSAPGLTYHGYEKGWGFAEAPKAYAAVLVAVGGAVWEQNDSGQSGQPEIKGKADKNKVARKKAKLARSQTQIPGSWLRCDNEWTPVILEVARKQDFTGMDGFKKAIVALPVLLQGNKLTYKGLSGDSFAFFIDQRKIPEINGQPVNYSTLQVFDSPFIQEEWNSGIVTIAKDDRTLKLDFTAE